MLVPFSSIKHFSWLLPIFFHFFSPWKIKQIMSYLVHVLCVCTFKMSPLGNSTHQWIINKIQQLSKHFSVWKEVWRRHLLEDRDRWPYLSAPASTAVSGGNWEEGLWGLPCTLCPGEGWLTGCGGGTAPAAVPLRLEWLLEKMEAEIKGEQASDCAPSEAHIF